MAASCGAAPNYAANLMAATPKTVWGWVRAIGIFPRRDSLIRLADAMLAGQHDEWTEILRLIGLDILARCHVTTAVTSTAAEEVTLTAIAAEGPR